MCFWLVTDKNGSTVFSWIKITQPGRHPIECTMEFKAEDCLDTSLQGTGWREVARGEHIYGLWQHHKHGSIAELHLNVFLMVLDALTLAFPYPTAAVLRVTGLWNVKNCRAEYVCRVIHYLVKLGFSGTDRTPWMRACAVFALWWLSVAWFLGLHDPTPRCSGSNVWYVVPWPEELHQ